MAAKPESLLSLRRSLAHLTPARAVADAVGFGLPALDNLLGGGLQRNAIHEIYALEAADHPAATGLAMALSLRAARNARIVWARQDFLEAEAGHPYAPGLAEFGLSPDDVVLVKARDPASVLRIGNEAARCAALGAVLIEVWGEPKIFDLTASRRLALSAETSRVMVLSLRVGAEPTPSAATTRWGVRALPSTPLAAGAPGKPAFALTLLRSRAGLSGQTWRVEWDRDRKRFQQQGGEDRAALPRPLVAASGHREADEGTAFVSPRLRRTG